MVSENVPNHEDSLLRCGQFHQGLALFYIDSQWLLYENVFSGFKSRFGHFVVGDGRSRQSDSSDRRIREDCAVFGEELDAFIFVLAGRLDRFLGITERAQRAQFVKITNQVFAPVTNSYDGYVSHGFSGWPFSHECLPLPGGLIPAGQRTWQL